MTFETTANHTEALQRLADRVIELINAHDAAGARIEANVTVARTRHGLTRFANSFIHQHVGEDTVTVTINAAVDGRSTSASTTAVDDASLDDLVSRALASARLQPVDPFWPGATPPQPVTRESHVDEATASSDPQVRARGVKAFVDADPTLQGAGFLDTETNWVAFASTAGHRASGGASRATIDGIHQTATSAGSDHQTSRSITELDPAAAGARAADLARRSAEFVDVDPGEFEVVLSPDAVATIVVFLAAYGFNAKAHLEGASFVELDSQQFDSSLTLLEDPEDPRAIGLPFDAEGTPRRRYALIEDGITRNLAHDRRTAARAETETTGNALPGGAAFGALPTNPRLLAGEQTPQQLIAGVKRGLLVTQFHYCRVLEPKSMVVTGLTRNGTFLIEDGKLVGAVGNLRFTQPFVAGLSQGNVLGVGTDDRYANAEFGPGMVIAPSLRLRSWNFTGGAKG